MMYKKKECVFNIVIFSYVLLVNVPRKRSDMQLFFSVCAKLKCLNVICNLFTPYINHYVLFSTLFQLSWWLLYEIIDY